MSVDSNFVHIDMPATLSDKDLIHVAPLPELRKPKVTPSTTSRLPDKEAASILLETLEVMQKTCVLLTHELERLNPSLVEKRLPTYTIATSDPLSSQPVPDFNKVLYLTICHLDHNEIYERGGLELLTFAVNCEKKGWKP